MQIEFDDDMSKRVGQLAFLVNDDFWVIVREITIGEMTSDGGCNVDYQVGLVRPAEDDDGDRITKIYQENQEAVAKVIGDKIAELMTKSAETEIGA